MITQGLFSAFVLCLLTDSFGADPSRCGYVDLNFMIATHTRYITSNYSSTLSSEQG